MKKSISIILALVLAVSLSVPAFAVDSTREVQLSYTHVYTPAAPKYSVTIPGTLNLNKGDNYLTVSVSVDNVVYTLPEVIDYSVAVTFEGTGYQIDSNTYYLSLFPAGYSGNYNILDQANLAVKYGLYDSWGYAVSYPENRGDYSPAGFATYFRAAEAGAELAYLNLEDTWYDGGAISAQIRFVVDEAALNRMIDDGYIQNNVKYSGTITFGIKLIEI